ncbi:MAG: hypothetical protein MZU79_09350 [Anaerotruncus sp.]|nr:hypothetical protein [Anaerotruncus sp.]
MPPSLKFGKEAVGHFDDIDIPGIDLPPLGKPYQDLDRIFKRSAIVARMMAAFLL